MSRLLSIGRGLRSGRQLAPAPLCIDGWTGTGEAASLLGEVEHGLAAGHYTQLRLRLDRQQLSAQSLVDSALHEVQLQVCSDRGNPQEFVRALVRARKDRPRLAVQLGEDLSAEAWLSWIKLCEEQGVEELQLGLEPTGLRELPERVRSRLGELAVRAPWRRPRLIAEAPILQLLQQLPEGADESGRLLDSRAGSRDSWSQPEGAKLSFAPGAPRLSIVVPTCTGSKAWLVPCLRSISQLRGPPFEVVVVLDGPAPDLTGLIRTELPAARELRLSVNRGFAHAANAGLRSARGELLALINDDTELAPDWLQEIDRAARSHPNAGFFASRILQHAAPELVDSAGHGMTRWGEVFERGSGSPDSSAFDPDCWVLGAPASAAVYRRELIRDCRGFDEGFEAYLEDLDLSLRAQLLGYPCLYVGGARLSHHRSRSYGARAAQRARLLARNRIRLLLRAMPSEVVAVGAPAILLSQLIGLASDLLHSPSKLAALSGSLEAVSAARESLAQRPAVLGRRRVDGRWSRAIFTASERQLLELCDGAGAGQLRRRRATLCRLLGALVDLHERLQRPTSMGR